MTKPNQELNWLLNSAREAANEGRNLTVDPGYVLEALEKLAEARARVAELEAAQRPPLGYVVASSDPDSGQVELHGRVRDTREDAEGWLRWLERIAVPGWCGEIREVR
ncbi:hypothetical protein [Nocardia asiatica]|uniref:hypothetical protein n=1 Tax=Nocardia asiatica TaxID=209252 RepID=UPI0024590196|nr:hypothetical protein [Nocardia asiatica]